MSLSINKTEFSSLHFIGIYGSGMSSLAQYTAWHGLRISGSDRLLNDDSTRHINTALKSLGCHLYPQDGSGITGKTQACVVSTAIEESNPDCKAARALGIPLFHRSEVLAAIVNSKKTIAVAGTSGKSTVTALIFHLLNGCGKSPSMISGANLHELAARGYIGNAFYGNSDYLVIEADESDGSCVHYHPYISVLLNLTKDHKPPLEILEYLSIMAKQSTHVFVNYDDPALRSISPAYTFGLLSDAPVKPQSWNSDAASATLTLDSMPYTVPFPGTYMIHNMLAAIQVCLFCGCTPQTCASACATYQGIQRRFDRIQTRRGVTVIDDYAHNPDKISAAVQTVQSLGRTVFILFQPHGFGPTRFLLHEFIEVFNRLPRSTDTLCLLPIYYAGGTVTRDISTEDIARGLGKCAASVVTPAYREEIIDYIARHAQKGDIVLSMGARDPSLPIFAREIARQLDK